MPTKPKAVKVGGYHAVIEYKKDLRHSENNNPAWGYANLDMSILQIEEAQPPRRMTETFLHEVLHLVDHDRSIGLTEEQVCKLAPGLLALIVDNSEIFGEHFLEQWKGD